MTKAYVSLEEVLAVFDDIHPLDHNANAYLSQIKEIPIVDVQPIVHGKWIPETITEKFHMPIKRCSICGCNTVFVTNFCPYCGADMRKVADK